MEDDLVLDTTDVGQPYPIQIIENQLQVIISVLDVDEGIYTDIAADKAVVLGKAFKLIYKAQKALDKSL
jgi:hypothetical protein